MSRVTTAVLMVDECVDDDIYPQGDPSIIGHPFGAPSGRPEQGQHFRLVTDQGGHRVGCDTYTAGFNYVPGSELSEWFHSRDWGGAVLVWETEGDQGFGVERAGIWATDALH